MSDEFKREPRYIVIKIKDALAHLSACQLDRLQEIGETVSAGRSADGKPPFNAVVVEQDWPEFEPIWKAIEARMTGRAIEAEVRAEAQEPVATKLETQQFNCFHVSAEDFTRLAALPVGAKLYTAPQPPAPCPKCTEYSSQLIRAQNSDEHNFNRWQKAQAKVADLTREVAQWKNGHATVVRQARVLKERTDMPLERVKAYEHYGEMIERVAQQAERIAELEKIAQAYEDQVAAHNKTLDELKYTGLAAAAEAKRGDELQSQVAEQAALIEKCEKALQQVGQALAWLAFGECRSYGEGVPLLIAPDADAFCKEALAAIAAHRSQSCFP